MIWPIIAMATIHLKLPEPSVAANDVLTDNYILSYYQAIVNGSTVVGAWIRKLYAKIVDDLENGAYIFDQKKANNAIRFIERFMHHNKGKLAAGRLILSLWQKAAVSCIFGLVDDTGYRHFREVFMVVGRKCGKTLLAAAIMLYMVYGEQEFGAEVYCVAPKLDQSDLVYSAFKFSVDQEPSLSRRTKPRKNDLYVKECNASIRKIAFNEKKGGRLQSAADCWRRGQQLAGRPRA